MLQDLFPGRGVGGGLSPAAGLLEPQPGPFVQRRVPTATHRGRYFWFRGPRRPPALWSRCSADPAARSRARAGPNILQGPPRLPHSRAPEPRAGFCRPSVAGPGASAREAVPMRVHATLCSASSRVRLALTVWRRISQNRLHTAPCNGHIYQRQQRGVEERHSGL